MTRPFKALDEGKATSTVVGDAGTTAGLGHDPRRPKPYLSVAEVAELTPFTELAIRTMMARGILKKDVHYFDVGRRRVLKWQAIVDFIEGKGVENHPKERIPLSGGGYLGEPEEAEEE